MHDKQTWLTWGLNTKLRGTYDQNNQWQDGTNEREQMKQQDCLQDIKTMNQSEHDTWSKGTIENKTEITWETH